MPPLLQRSLAKSNTRLTAETGRTTAAMPSLSIVIPAYNEAARISSTVRTVARHLRSGPFGPSEIVVVDDGSVDGTAELARGDGRAPVPLTVLRNGRNRGKGFSVRRGMRAASQEWILVTDADLSTPISELDKLLRAALAGGYDVAIGSRAKDRSLIGVRQPLYREAAGRLFNLHMRLFTGLDIADTQCGFKLFRRAAARRIAALQRSHGFGFDVEQLYLARKLGFEIVEVAVRWDNCAESSVGVGGGMGAFLDLWRLRWNELTGRYSQARPAADPEQRG